MDMKPALRGIGALGMVLLIGLPVLAQAPADDGRAIPPMTNLQVWPKNASPAQVLQTMQAFNESLGVECSYCHVAGNFASDEKREKRVARQMILLRDSINVMLAAFVGKPAGAGPTSGSALPGAPVRVLCRSCHRGLPVPTTLAAVVNEAAAGGGVAAGVEKYQELRAKYYGGQEYDFGEAALLGIAQGALNQKKPDDAIRYLMVQLEHFPKSAGTYRALAQARAAKGDTQGAIGDLEKALELDPQSAQTRNQLAQLKGR